MSTERTERDERDLWGEREGQGKPPPGEQKAPMSPRSLIPRKEEETKELVPFNKDGGTGEILSLALVRALVLYGQKYGLDPYADELIYYYGEPYVTERGALHNACRAPRYRGHVLSLVPPEEKEAMGLGKEDIAYRCDVFVEGLDRPVTEFGEVTEKEVKDAEARYREKAQFLPLVKSPGKMARARAIRRAHLLAFPLQGEAP